jgi:hypothetical protein
MNIANKIKKYIEETYFTNYRVIYGKPQFDFDDICADKTMTTMGWNTPLKIVFNSNLGNIGEEIYRIAVMQCSPESKGCRQTVFFDFITEHEYNKRYENNSRQLKKC